MRDLLASLLGVPATIILTAGLGIMVVTLVNRLNPRRRRAPIRWAHLGLGLGLAGLGGLLLQLDLVALVR